MFLSYFYSCCILFLFFQRSFVRNSLMNGHKPFGIRNGFEGFIANDIHEIKWSDVTGWIDQGGSLLGTRRTLPDTDYQAVADQITKHNIHGIMIIGGFDAFNAAVQLADMRGKHHQFCIPICLLPATISNNVPGTEFSVGADTALNEATEICDRLRRSAEGSKRRVFIVETMGGYCGYLATMTGLAGGSDAAYIHEEKFGIRDLTDDLQIMAQKMQNGKIERGLILRNENANKNYDTDFITRY